MVNEYTPDEFNVRMAWVTTGIGPEDNLNAEFDRWLAGVKRAAKAEALAEAGLREEWGVRWDNDAVWACYLNRAEAEAGASEEGEIVRRYLTDWKAAP